MDTARTEKPRLFPALLKYWRGRRGMSQLDLALSADVSSRHISFMETGRSKPSEEMVLRLAATLDVPMREQNNLLRAAGFEPVFDERDLASGAPPEIRRVIERMMVQQEPYPMVVMNRAYDVLNMNAAAQRLLPRLVADPTALLPPVNAMKGLFDPAGFRPFIVDWEDGARMLLARLHREALHHPEDERLAELVEAILAFPDVPEEWRIPDFSRGSEPTFRVRLKRGDVELAFLTTMTVFSAPQNVTLDDVQIESYFPLDEETQRFCESLASP